MNKSITVKETKEDVVCSNSIIYSHSKLTNANYNLEKVKIKGYTFSHKEIDKNGDEIFIYNPKN